MGNPDRQQPFTLFNEQVTALRSRIGSLMQRAATTGASGSESDAALTESLQELSVAEEELRQQGEELLAARDLLEAERDRYRELFDAAPDACFFTDPQGNICDANRAAVARLGREPQHLRGKPLAVYVAPEHQPAFHAALERLNARRWDEQDAVQVTLQTAAGERWGAELRASPVAHLAHPGGLEAGVWWVCRDVTERRRAEELLRASEQRYRELVQYAPVGIYELDFRGRKFISVNDAVCLLTGYTRDELMGMSPFDILDDESKAVFHDRIAQWLSGRKPEKNVEYKVRAKDGHVIYALLDVTFTVNDQGRPVGATVIGYDITERKRAELERERLLAELTGERVRWQATVESMLDLVTVCNARGQSVYMNAAYTELVGRTIDATQPPDAQPQFYQLYRPDGTLFAPADLPLQRAALHGERVRNVEVVQRTTSGGEVICVWNAAPLRGTDGRVTGAVAVGHEVTQQRRAERALRESEERLAKTFRSSPAALSLSRLRDGLFMDVNDSFLDLFGYTYEELIGHTAVELGIYPDPAVRGAFAQQARERGALRDREITVRAKSGRLLTVLFSVELIESGGETYALITALDVTERRRVEDALRQSEERARRRAEELEALMDLIPTVVWVAQDPQCRVITGNRAASRLYESRAGDNMSAGTAEGRLDTTRTYSRNGRELRPEELPMQVAAARNADVRDAELDVRLPSGRVITLLGNASPLRDAEGRVRGCLGVFVDITDRKRSEAEREHLLEAETRARLEAERQNDMRLRFLGMISHELRTPLTSIKGFATTLLADDVEWDEASRRDFLRTIDQEADKLTDMIDQLLDLARIEAGTLRVNPAPQHIAGVLAAAGPQLQLAAGQHPLAVGVAEGLPAVNADRQRVTQVLENLVGNAARYAPPGTPITITITLTATRAGQEVRVSVSDAGPGIAPEDRPRVFEAFTRGTDDRTRQTKGAGLGLAICKGIVEAHGGRVWIEDHEGPGTTVSFTLPLAV